jgi:hypothetical protein
MFLKRFNLLIFNFLILIFYRSIDVADNIIVFFPIVATAFFQVIYILITNLFLSCILILNFNVTLFLSELRFDIFDLLFIIKKNLS